MSNSDIFIRSSQSGIAYQSELDENARTTGSLLGANARSKSANSKMEEKI